MKNNSLVISTVLVGTLLIFSPEAVLTSDDTLLKDASFELKLPASKGGWSLFDVSLFSQDQARSGSKSMFNGGLSRTVAYHPYFIGVVSGSFQEFPADPGSRWRFTGYGFTARQLEGAPAFGILQMSFFDADGNDLGTVETAQSKAARAKTSDELNNRSPVGQWLFLDTDIATAPAGTATVQAFTLYVDYSGSDISQGVYFDDLSLCALEHDDDGCEVVGCGRLGSDQANVLN